MTQISEKSGNLSLVFLSVGCPQKSLAFGWISIGADAILAIDDLINGNYQEAMKEGLIVVASIVTPMIIGKGVTTYSKTIKITI